MPRAANYWFTGVLTRKNDDFTPHYGGITDIAFSPEGRYLASGGLDKTVKIWDVEAEAQVLDRDFLNYVETVAWSPDGSQHGGWQRRTVESSFGTHAAGRETARFEGHRNGAVSALDYAPDGSRIVTAGTDGSVRVWNARKRARNSTNCRNAWNRVSRFRAAQAPRRAGVVCAPRQPLPDDLGRTVRQGC